jgi:hypothetical protein
VAEALRVAITTDTSRSQVSSPFTVGALHCRVDYGQFETPPGILPGLEGYTGYLPRFNHLRNCAVRESEVWDPLPQVNVPRLNHAVLSSLNDMMIMAEEHLRPLRLVGSEVKSQDMNLHLSTASKLRR